MTTRFWKLLVLVLRVRVFELAIDAWQRKAILQCPSTTNNQRDAVESPEQRGDRRLTSILDILQYLV
jgi:hypothetical protein